MHAIRTCLLTLIALTLAPASARSAEQNWNGFYLGGNLGYGLGKASADFSVLGVPALSASETLKGWVGGVQAGYNWQRGFVVAGVELDVQATGQKAHAVQTCVSAACGLLAIPQTSD